MRLHACGIHSFDVHVGKALFDGCGFPRISGMDKRKITGLFNRQWPPDKEEARNFRHMPATENRYVHSHFSAARLHKLHARNSSTLIHKTAAHHGAVSGTSTDGAVHFARLAPGGVVEKLVPGAGPVRMNNLDRTVAQCAMAANFEQAVTIGDSALHNALELNELRALLDRTASGRGIRQARRVVSAFRQALRICGRDPNPAAASWTAD